MNLNEVKALVADLEIGETKCVYRPEENVVLSIRKPLKQGSSLKHQYDPARNFQIVMQEPEREFLPNHLRILLDLYLKRTTNPEGFVSLFDAIQSIYEGDDPDKYRDNLSHLDFPMRLDSPLANLCLSRLFMAEQDINDRPEWKVKPARAYLMGYIRMVNAQDHEISWILWSATRHPPRKEYRTPPRNWP